MANRNDVHINGISGIEYSAGSDVFNDTCYCPSSGCPLPGVRSPGLCKGNVSPMFISFPHFYLADKSYRERIVGMNPDRTAHEFNMVLENVSTRIKFNIYYTKHRLLSAIFRHCWTAHKLSNTVKILSSFFFFFCRVFTTDATLSEKPIDLNFRV